MLKTNRIKLAIAMLSLAFIIFSCSKQDDTTLVKQDPIVLSFLNEINADSLQKKVQWLQNMGSRFALNNDCREVAVKIKTRFISYGYTNASLDSFYYTKTYMGTTYNAWGYNVIAKIEGEENPDSVCILGGHYDSIIRNTEAFSIAPGANDNASGTSATLEVARVLKTKNFSPKSTIEFICFGAEELGLLGSYDYAQKSNAASKKIRFMLNNDMIAYWPTNTEPMIVNIIDYPSVSTNLRLDAEKVCQLYTSLETNNDNTYYRSSDSYPFFLNGYKAIFFITNASDPNYHTTNDLVSNCNFSFCQEVVKISCALLVNCNR